MNQKIHFQSIDALRFFAFFKVFLLHFPIQGDFPIFNYLKSGGGIGVSFFFVLSGFLITYLLTHDKKVKGQINLKNFFMRRSLRIWPLFYLLVIIALFLPYQFKTDIGFHMVSGGYEPNWKYSFTFLENYNMLFQDNFPNTTPLPVFWSLCIEEHFYLFWMISIFILPLKRIFGFLIFCIGFAWIARFAEPFIFHNQMITTNDLFTNMDYFAIGGILGYLAAMQYEKISIKINAINIWFKRLYILLVVLIVIFQNDVLPYQTGSIFNIFRPTIIAILFTLLVAVFIPNGSKISIKSKVLNYLGSISYGLYVFHIMFIHISFQYVLNNDLKLDNWTNIIINLLFTLGGSILLSALSYHYFEKPFLRLRDKWSKKTKDSILAS